MATSAASFASDLPGGSRRPATVHWTIWAGVLAVTSSSIGGSWDVAWHRSIGRDAFLTAPHLAIYACGVIAAVVCGYLILYTTFGRSQQLKRESVSVLGFRAPLGAFLAAWGGIAMLTSAPFDNWWHNAYGLDVKIISPPHTLLILGIRGVSVGVQFLILASMNRAAQHTRPGDEALHRTLQKIFLYMGGLMIVGQMFFLQEETWDILLHRATAYTAMAIGLPVAFAVLSRASGSRWASTLTAGIYTLFAIAEILVFPLVPASPKLGPVYFPVTHLVPAKFPILILLPAFALDLLWQRTRTWKTWQIAAISGVLFTAVLFLVEWPFASFLMSKASQNRFFGTIYFDYNSRPNGWDRLRVFVEPDSGPRLALGLVRACVYGAIGTGLGWLFGGWMKKVQR